jgi:hypothetical protein
MRALAAALEPHGLILRGGFHPAGDDPGLAEFATVLLVGNAGGAMWRSFAADADGSPHALDRWTQATVDPIASRFGAVALYPFETPHRPFQRWAQRAEAVFVSPLGVLIHPVYGLWHAYRAALGFAKRLPLPPRQAAVNPCTACRDKPCLTACPVGAFAASYDLAACAAHLAATDAGGAPTASCHDVGCHARSACPVGEKWRYPPPQIRFHMAAFARSVAAA